MWGGKKNRSEKVSTLIGQQTELHGDIVFSGGLHVDGKIKGSVLADRESSTMLVISDKGSVEGEIRAPFIVVNGLVIGDIYASESIELAQNARITGDVYYNRIEVVMGAEVNGNLVHFVETNNLATAAGVSLSQLKEVEGNT